MVDFEAAREARDTQIYKEYLEGLKYRAVPQAKKFGLSLSRYKAIITAQRIKQTGN